MLLSIFVLNVIYCDLVEEVMVFIGDMGLGLRVGCNFFFSVYGVMGLVIVVVGLI